MKNRVIPLEVKGTVNTIINGKRRRTVEEHEKYVDMRNACYRKRSNRNSTINYFTGFDDGFEQAKKQLAEQIEKMKLTEQNMVDKLWKEWDRLLGVSN